MIFKIEEISRTRDTLNTAQSRLKSAYDNDTSHVQPLHKTLLIGAELEAD